VTVFSDSTGYRLPPSADSADPADPGPASPSGGVWGVRGQCEHWQRAPSVQGTTSVVCLYSRGGGPVELIAYYRVSTARQGESGLGLEAQRSKVEAMAAERRAVVVAEFVEIESGRKVDRPQLAAALAEARKRGAAVAVAKLDRIARDAELVLRLSREAEANGMAGFLFCDLPDVDATTAAGRMVLSVMASVAEFESRRISERTRDALAAAKERGVKLGGLRPGTITRNDAAKDRATAEAETLRPLLAPMVAAGYSLRRISEALAAAGTVTRSGSPLSASGVRNLLQRLELGG
jgi:DNA invertase Pin-like site-specific DNA recombinase